MIAVKENEAIYLAHFAQRERTLAARAPAWLHEIRRAAIDAFAERGFPTIHEEEWKYTSVAPLANLPFQPARRDLNASLTERIQRLPLADLECNRLVFFNGHYRDELSALEGLPKGIRAGSLAAALAGDSSSLDGPLGNYAADYKDHPFVALNTAFFEDGAFIEIPKGLVLEKPLLLLYVSDSGGEPAMSHPRTLILAGRESQAAIIEAFVGLAEGVYFTNAVTELVLGEGAVVDYHKIQQESGPSFHYARVQIHQDRASTATTHSIALGGRLTREEVQTVLAGEGAEATLNGLYVTSGDQHVDNHTTLDHAKPHCSSREFYKGVLEGKSSAVFNGKIIVRKDAQKTDSKQSNKNLLLSEGAVINTKPALEIYADDVKCTHGATIGQIDPDAIFYLRSRGIGRQEARDLLTYAFVNDILERIKYAPLRERLKGEVFARLARGQQAEEA